MGVKCFGGVEGVRYRFPEGIPPDICAGLRCLFHWAIELAVICGGRDCIYLRAEESSRSCEDGNEDFIVCVYFSQALG